MGTGPQGEGVQDDEATGPGAGQQDRRRRIGTGGGLGGRGGGEIPGAAGRGQVGGRGIYDVDGMAREVEPSGGLDALVAQQ